MVGVAVAVLLAVVMLPLPALAFGPVAHVDMGLDVITQAAGLASAAAAVVRAHPQEFLRGTLGPDRELAKNLAAYEKHSHNWERVLRQLDGAGDDPARSFFLGCLCHLAADVVAHNYFVPMKIVESHRARYASHLYWEMRFDARVRKKGQLKAIRALGLNSREHRRFLDTVVPGNLLGPRFNVRLTGMAMRLQRAMAFQSLSSYLDRESRLSLADPEVRDVRRLAIASQLSVVAATGQSPVAAIDARGIDSIARALRIRRHLRALVFRLGEPNPQAARIVHESVREFRGQVAVLPESRRG